MANTIANVLTGVATLGIRQPNDAIAEWSNTHAHQGTHSAKLYKGGTGNAGSTHIEIIPPTGETITTWVTGCAANQYTFWYYYEAGTQNWVQIEFYFEDDTVGSEGWAEITCVPHQNHIGTATWLQYDLVTDPVCGFGGWAEIGEGAPFFDWSLVVATNKISQAVGVIDGLTPASCGDWVLKRIRYQLWEAGGERSAWIDEVVLNGIAYTIEPGGDAPGMSLSSPFTDVGYTEDGVTLDYTADTSDIEVEEETFPIDRVITKETCAVTCNMAESSLYNIDKAMAGSLLSGSIIKLGAGTMKTMNLKIAGTNPAGFNREIFIPVATSTGAVGMAYKKGEKTVVPVTFQALKGDSPAVTIVDNAA